MNRTMPAVVVAAAALLTLAGCQSTATTVNTTPASTTAAAAPAAGTTAKAAPATTAPPAKKAGVGSAIDVKGGKAGSALQVTLVKIVDPAKSDNEFLVPTAGSHFVAVQLKIVNKGTDVYSDDPQLLAKVKDAEGESFNFAIADTTAGTAMDPSLKLAPGDTALGFLTFEVPDGKKVAQVQYSAGLYGGDVAQWTVG